MKICVLTHTFPKFPNDVSAPFMDGVATGQSLSGNEVHVLTPYSPSFKRKKNDQVYKIHTYKYMPFDSWHRLGYSETLTNDMKLKKIMYVLSPFMYLFGTITLLRLVKKEKIDLINAHWILPNGFIAAVVSKITGVPVVATLPGSDVYMAGKNALFQQMAAFASNTSLAITSNSPQLLTDLAHIVGTSKKDKNEMLKKSHSIIYGTDILKFKPDSSRTKILRKKFNIKKSELIIISVGRLVEKKGFKYLIEAAAKLLKKGQKVRFIIIGEGDARAELEALSKRHSISESVLLPGWVNYKDLVHYYNLADIFILPSVRDSDGNLDDQSVAVVEAMSCGKPVITSDFLGYRLIVSHNQNGYLLPEKDSNAIAKHILKLINSSQLRKEFGLNSRKFVQKKFTWEAIGKEYSNLFTKLISEKKDIYSLHVPKILHVAERKEKAQQIVNVLKDKVTNLQKKNCLDIGCATGVMTAVISKQFRSTIGIDYDYSAIDQAKKLKTKAKFEVSNGERLSFRNNSFDIVIANQIYNSTENLESLMSEVYRVLKKEGVCYFSGRNKYALVERQYDLPLLSWLPKPLATLYLRLAGKGDMYYGNYMSHAQIVSHFKKFKITDMTLEILSQPGRFGFKEISSNAFMKIIPLKVYELLIPLIPNYIWLLTKK